MFETSKSKAAWSDLELSVFQGEGIDIGCGPDPVFPSAKPFDLKQGDANHITRFVSGTFDYVYSSHCLEHMHEPRNALAEWWQLVKPGGHLFFIVPDEDLYEQGFFPSLFNPDHKATFTVLKERSWSPVSYSVRELADGLPGGKVLSLTLQDRNYDRSLLFPLAQRPGWFVHKASCAYAVITTAFHTNGTFLDPLIKRFHPIDQLRRPGTLAQIQCIVKKLE